MPTSEENINRQIRTIKKQLTSRFIYLKNRIIKQIVNEQESENLYYEIETTARKYLRKIFGHEQDIGDRKLSQAFLRYADFSDAVIFNYWSYKGEPIETVIDTEDEKPGRWRDNIYYKGVRWSDQKKRRLFYEFFDEIKSSLQGEAPVDFFTKYGVEYKLRHLKIIGINTNSPIKIEKASEYEKVVIPILAIKNINSAAFKELITLVNNMKHAIHNETTKMKFSNDNKKALRSLDKYAKAAYLDAKNLDKDLIEAFRMSIIKGLAEEEAAKKKLNKEITLHDAFNVMIAYQYYDHPYDIHMFLPQKTDDLIPYSCLVITVRRNSREIESYGESFKDLADALGRITSLERLILEQRKDNLPIYWRWRRYYDTYSDQHTRLSNVALNICLAICRKEKAEVFSIPARLKKFDSFYNKIVNRANGRDKSFPVNERKLRNSEWKEKRKDILGKYAAVVLAPTKRNAERILKELKDVVGLRIICLYRKEIGKVIRQFRKLRIEGQISNLEEKSYKDPLGYRSTHVSFSLGKKRDNLYELDDLRDRRCEIQVRTILDEGWADISHKVVYKPGVPQLMIEEIKKQIKDELSTQAKALLVIDNNFDGIVRRVQSMRERAI